jgi:hypothetical protein
MRQCRAAPGDKTHLVTKLARCSRVFKASWQRAWPRQSHCNHQQQHHGGHHSGKLHTKSQKVVLRRWCDSSFSLPLTSWGHRTVRGEDACCGHHERDDITADARVQELGEENPAEPQVLERPRKGELQALCVCVCVCVCVFVVCVCLLRVVLFGWLPWGQATRVARVK